VQQRRRARESFEMRDGDEGADFCRFMVATIALAIVASDVILHLAIPN
jgi:hypothetical protein